MQNKKELKYFLIDFQHSSQIVLNRFVVFLTLIKYLGGFCELITIYQENNTNVHCIQLPKHRITF